ncbi:MAG: arsenical pump family protein [Candidatus Peregrinibacteria bacterium GW2011_GWE2_39_6]|nr:MAG: arsenical pump family protein [Candidatus Peregrinibacteria bacterium GW2011_GWF2_39_17]KKR26142.1 MAG: arsenical pump family protein [Candidatus Peregrinibacteria bacterium GW2011_GWE2_39_6]HCW32332.1 hypothetical protein [Candidatus Peregrinibacteria bacterium]
MLTWIVIAIFLVTFLLIVFEVFDKAILALMGAVLMIVFGVFDFHEAIEAIQFETIVLLMSMMLLVEVARESGIFSWVTVQLSLKSGGNPLLLFLFLSCITFFTSAFLDNVTTIILLVPITIALVRGVGGDPKPYIIAEIFFADIGGVTTLIGDPSNIIIGGATHFTFNQFLFNLGIPGLTCMITVFLIFVLILWKNHLHPISNDLKKLFSNHLLLHKISYTFLRGRLNKVFMLKSVIILFLTIFGFFFQSTLGISVAMIALIGALMLLLVAADEADIHVSLRSVEWSTLLFFSGLFIMVGAMEKVGVLGLVSNSIIDFSGDNFMLLLLCILWGTGFTSMVLENTAFVTLMVPVIFSVQAQLPPTVNASLLWWALSLGACLGGCGTPIGASANVVALALAEKNDSHISFLGFLKYSLPFTILMLTISSIYLTLRVFYF